MRQIFLQKVRKAPPPPNNGAVFLPILSLMLILIPILVGNLAFSHLRVLDINLPENTSQEISASHTTTTQHAKIKVILLLTLQRTRYISELIEEKTGRILLKRIFPPTIHSETEIQKELEKAQKDYSIDTVLVSSHKDIQYDQIVGVLESCRTPTTPKVSSNVKLILLPSEGV